MKPTVPPQLDAPGAGLPWLEHKIANLLFHRTLRRSTPASRQARFDTARTAIRERIAEQSPERLAERVLIKRLRGLEDSSRHWSVLMTLHHLHIVNLATAGIARELGRGKVPALVADTATVKPDPAIGPEIVEDFERSCDLVTRLFGKLDEPDATPRFDHPWFGPLPAAGWHHLEGIHLGLHLKQIDAILAAAV